MSCCFVANTKLLCKMTVRSHNVDISACCTSVKCSVSHWSPRSLSHRSTAAAYLSRHVWWPRPLGLPHQVCSAHWLVPRLHAATPRGAAQLPPSPWSQPRLMCAATELPRRHRQHQPGRWRPVRAWQAASHQPHHPASPASPARTHCTCCSLCPPPAPAAAQVAASPRHPAPDLASLACGSAGVEAAAAVYSHC